MKIDRPLFWPVLSGVLTAAGLLSPLLLLGVRGLTITGMTEESTGYRYFYTLRMLYGQDEIPWVPQGQLPGIAHTGLQLALTLAGLSPTTLHPRIDIFGYAAAALPHILAGAAFAWMAAALPARARLATIAGAGLMVAVFLPNRTGWGYNLVLPDYMSWAEPIGLITAGWLLRLQNERDRQTWTSDIRLGIFTGLCLAVKPTFVVFAVPIAVLVAITMKSRVRALLIVSNSVMIGCATWLTLTWAYYLGSVPATLSHFVNLRAFVANVSANASLREWISGPGLWNTFDATNLALLMPIGLLATTLLTSYRSVSAALLLGSLLSLYVAYRRFEAQTLVEVNAYFVAAFIAWSVGVVDPSFADVVSASRWRRTAARLALIGLTVGVWALAARQIWMVEKSMIPVFEMAHIEGRRVAACLTSNAGKTLFLIPDNNLRPTTVDSAVFKGGTDIHRYYWGASRFVHNMFPDRGYLVGNTSRPTTLAELDSYSKILFVSLPGQRERAIAGLKQAFGISPDDFACSCVIDFRYHLANVCYR